MHDEAARKLIQDTFNQPYDLGRFRTFIRELMKGYDERGTSAIVPDSFEDSIKSVYRIGTVKDEFDNEIDLLAVTLAKDTSLERARTMQRNFLARHLSKRNKEAALVAFVAPGDGSWRFSLVRRELSLTKSLKGKTKALQNFSPARRFSFLVGSGEKTHTVKRQILKFLTTDDRPSLRKLEEAFNIETVTDEFFEEYRELFNKANDAIAYYLKNNKKIADHFKERDIDGPDFAKRLLGQIVFLYFLQKKGWLGVPRGKKWGEGSRTFLRDLYEKSKAEKSNFFNNYLEPLFYEALNRDHSDEDHYHELFKSRIPFLNGGLFEPYHNYDWIGHDIELPNTLFSELGHSLFGEDGVGILDVFDRYNFTVAEDEPLEREVAIDPEMLGKVFERLLPVKERGKLGTFYTPREIVHYMCQESLIAYLSGKFPVLNKDELEDFIRYGDLLLEHDAKVLRDGPTDTYKDVFLGQTLRDRLQDIDDALRTVKVCDPAIGSGAFPVGMMSEIVRARKVLALHMRKSDGLGYELKRQTIQDCLYGVDLDPGAIEIAKLRLWLSLVVDEDSFDDIQALPNLDYKIMQGNSLLQTFEGIKLFDDSVLKTHDNAIRRKKQLQAELDTLQTTFMTLRGSTTFAMSPKQKQAIEKDIKKKKDEIAALETSSSDKSLPLLADQSRAVELAEQLKALHADFFRSARPAEKKKLKAAIEELEWRLLETSMRETHQNRADSQLSKIKELQRANVKPYFLWKLHFNEVFSGEQDGFDIVIANPPYVSIEKFSGTYEQDEWKKDFSVFSARGDIYCLFYEQGFRILKPSGILCFIASNKFFRAGYGNKLRTYLATNVVIKSIIDFGELPVFEAGVDPSIILSQNALPNNDNKFLVATIKNKEDIRDLRPALQKLQQDRLQTSLGESVWSFESSEKEEILSKIKKNSTTLSAYISGKIISGIKTGFNEAFVIDEETKNRLIKEDKKSAELIKPWVRGRDIIRWGFESSNLYIIAIPYQFNSQISKYTAIYNHLQKFEKQLRARGQCEGKPSSPGSEQHHWVELDNNPGQDYFQKLANEKIIYAEIAKYMRACLDSTGSYPDMTNFVIPTGDLYVLSILNSKVIDWVSRMTLQTLGDPWNGGRLRFKKQYVSLFPIPDADQITKDRIILIAKEIALKVKDNPEFDIATLEKTIDSEVYKLYGLTTDEISIIESALGAQNFVSETDNVGDEEEAQAAPALHIDLSTLPDGAWARTDGEDIAFATHAQLATIIKLLAEPMPVSQVRLATLYALEPHYMTKRLSGAARTTWLRLVGSDAAPRTGNIAAFAPRIDAAWGRAETQLIAGDVIAVNQTAKTWSAGAAANNYPTQGTWQEGRAYFVLNALKNISFDDATADLAAEDQNWIAANAA